MSPSRCLPFVLLFFVGAAASQPLVNIRLEIVDAGGTPISSAAVGDDIGLNIYVQDLRSSFPDAGVFAAYIDVAYDAALASFNPPIVFGADYQVLTSGLETLAGLVEDVGAVQTDIFGGPLGAMEFLLASLDFSASAAGTLVVSTGPADGDGKEILLLVSTSGEPEDEAVAPADTIFGTAEVQILGDGETPTPTIPAPGTIALLGLGLAGLGVAARRRPIPASRAPA